MSNSDPYWRGKELFVAALEKSCAEREAFLRGACAEDSLLFEEMSEMLAAHDRASGVMVHPTFDAAKELHADASPSERPGDAIGPYKLLQQIGEGGFGTVYMAEQEHPVRRRVALKIIKLGMDTKQVIARFEAERQALAIMDHAGIAKVFDAGATQTGRPYFVMELVNGIPITEYCDKNELNIPDRLELFVQVCQAVQHAHQKGLIHRDLKPSNVLVSIQDDRPIARVIDFGIAKATQARLTEKTLFTEFRQLIGTPEYMSPEQADASFDIDTRSDVYALGVLLYELLTGTTPFGARELRSKAYAEIQRIIREVEPPKPSTRLSQNIDTLAGVAAHRHTEPRKLSASVRGELDWIVMKCLEKDRARRYETASSLAMDVQRHLNDEPVAAGPPSARYRFRKFARRNKGPVIAIATIFIVLVAGIIGTTLGLIGQARQRVIAEQQRAAAQNQEHEARQQAASAEAVGKFQTDMLASADPEKLLGDKITVLQAVTASVKELDAGKLTDQPLVEASVRTTIGVTLRGLGRYGEAEHNLRKALELRRGSLPAGTRRIAQSDEELAVLLQAAGKFAEAEPLYLESVQIFRSLQPPDPEQLGTALNNFGWLLWQEGKLDESEKLVRETLDVYRKNLPTTHPYIGSAVNNLATLLQARGKLAEAEPVCREALALVRQTRPAGHPQIATPLINLARLLGELGRRDEQELLLREALEIYEKSLPPEHPNIAQCLIHLGMLRVAQARFADAEPMLRRALDIRRKSLPAGHPSIANALNNYGLALYRQGRLDEAAVLYREALEIGRKVGSVGRAELAMSLNNLGCILVEQGQLAEAEPMLREALTMRRSGPRQETPQLVDSLIALGRDLLLQGQFAEAELLLLEAEQLLTAVPQSPADYRRCTLSLVDLYSSRNQSEPGKGYDAKAEHWKAKLAALQPAPAPTSRP